MRLLRNHLRNIDLTEVQPKKLVVTRPAKLDLNSIEKWAPSPIALIRCQSQFLGGLPIDDMEWPGPNQAPAFTSFRDGIPRPRQPGWQIRVRNISFNDYRISRRQHAPVRIRGSQRRRDRFGRQWRAIMKFDTMPHPKLPALVTGRCLPGSCQGRSQPSAVIHRDQSFEHQPR